MFETLSYKKKFFILVFLLLVVGITAYKRSYKITIETATLVSETREKLKKVSNAQQHIAAMQAEVDYFDKVIGKESAHPDIVQQEIINTFSTLGTTATLIKLEELHKASDAYFNIYTNRLLITASFNTLLEVTYAYEKTFDFSRVVSLSFYIDKDPRTRKKKIIEQIIFQNYEKIH